jgi:uncharacterized protein YdaU (DUF1376 family)
MKDPAFMFYCNDWLSSPVVMAMEPLEELAYFRMLLFMWQSGDCSIPNDPERMARLTKTDVNTCSIVFEQTMNTHPLCSDKLTNQRLYDQWTERQEYRKRKSEAGKRSGESRRNTSSKAPKSIGSKNNEQTGTLVPLCSNKTRTNANPSSSSSSNYIYTPGEGFLIPSKINTPGVIASVGRWLAHLQQNHPHKVIEHNSPQEEALWRTIARWEKSPAEVEAQIDLCIGSDWQNLRPPEATRQDGTKSSTASEGQSSSAESWDRVCDALSKFDPKYNLEECRELLQPKDLTAAKALGGLTRIRNRDQFTRTAIRKEFLEAFRRTR